MYQLKRYLFTVSKAAYRHFQLTALYKKFILDAHGNNLKPKKRDHLLKIAINIACS